MKNHSWGQAATTLCQPRLAPCKDAARCAQGQEWQPHRGWRHFTSFQSLKCTHPTSKVPSWTTQRMTDTYAQGHVSSRWYFTADTRMSIPSLHPSDRRLPSVMGRQHMLCGTPLGMMGLHPVQKLLAFFVLFFMWWNWRFSCCALKRAETITFAISTWQNKLLSTIN